MKNVIKTILTYTGKKEFKYADGKTGETHIFLDSNMNKMEMRVINPFTVHNGCRVGVEMIIDNQWNAETKRYVTKNYIKSVVPVVED